MNAIDNWKRRRAARRNPCPLCERVYPVGVRYCEYCRIEIPNRYSFFYKCEIRINGAFIGIVLGTMVMVYLARQIIFRRDLPNHYFLLPLAGLLIGWLLGPVISRGLGRFLEQVERY